MSIERIYTKHPKGKHRASDEVESVMPSDEYKTLLASIPIKYILDDDRVKTAMYRRQCHREEVNEAIRVGKESLAFGYLVGMVMPSVISKVQTSALSPFRSLTSHHIHVILGMWIVQQLNDGIARLSQILPYNKKDTMTNRRKVLSELIGLGLVEELNHLDVHARSGKVLKPIISSTNMTKHYALTRLGEKLTDEFNAMFGTVHAKAIGGFWMSSLDKL
jgi:hypothetical protein